MKINPPLTMPKNIPNIEFLEPFGAYKPTLVQKLLIAITQKNMVARAAIRTRINRILESIRSGPIDSKLYGYDFRFFPFENTGDRRALLSPNAFDNKECLLIAKYLPKNGVFLDIGANIGVYTFRISSLRPDSKIYAFEPSPKLFEKLNFNLKLNNISNVKAFDTAISDFKGELSFSTENESLVLGSGNIHVKADTLIDFISSENLTSIGALKIDIEGAEDKALRPFFENSPKTLWPQIIVIEHVFPAQWNWNCINFLISNGYSKLWRGKMNTVFQLG
jgi:FkbM family methyltransferase